MTVTNRSKVPLFLFLVNSLVMQMVVGQDVSIVRFSTIYWALVLPALVFPLFALREIIGVLLSRGIFLSAFFVCAGAYHLLRGDYQTIIQLFLLVWVMAWCVCDSTDLAASDVVKLFAATILTGVIIALLTDLNPWGFFPNQTSSNYGVWRLSFFPHVANSATMSVIVLMFVTRDAGTARKYLIILLLCTYFLLFGFVRTMFVAAAMYLLLYAVFTTKRIRSPTALLMGAVLLTVISVAVEVLTVPALDVMQHSSLISRLLLRGETDLTTTEIYQQLYRPWLWKEHLSIFYSSPYFMGLGTFKLLDHVSGNLLPGLGASGSESLPTRLLATYGISAFFFFAFLISQLVRLARSRNAWACACFPSIVFVMMNWGSVFHPTNAFFVLFMLILTSDKAPIARDGNARNAAGDISLPDPVSPGCREGNHRLPLGSSPRSHPERFTRLSRFRKFQANCHWASLSAGHTKDWIRLLGGKPMRPVA